jgi:hypothetical protein
MTFGNLRVSHSVSSIRRSMKSSPPRGSNRWRSACIVV